MTIPSPTRPTRDDMAVNDALTILASPVPMRPLHRGLLTVFALAGGGHQAVKRTGADLAPLLRIGRTTYNNVVRRLRMTGWLTAENTEHGVTYHRLTPMALDKDPAEAAWEEALALCLPATPDDRTGTAQRTLEVMERWDSVAHTQRNVLLLYALLGDCTHPVEVRAYHLGEQCGLLPPAFSRAVRDLEHRGWLIPDSYDGTATYYRLTPRAGGQ
ncbi:MAG TPA: hypothetical protein VIM84_03695 [Gemmatimonadales bacterium]